MTTLDLRLEMPPAELLRRLPRRAGTFLLDGGGPTSWGHGEAILGCEATTVLALPNLGADPSDPLQNLEELTGAGAAVVCALGYDLGRWIEPIGPGPTADPPLPALFAASHPWTAVYSYGGQRWELRAPRFSEAEAHGIARRLEAMAGRAVPSRAPRAASVLTAEIGRAADLDAVRRVREYIAAGDVYQVNLSRRFRGPLVEAPADIFARLLSLHPAPWSGYLDGGDWALVSNSPECFLHRSGERISTFPIKGTRPRGSDAAGDKAMAAALLSSVKDRAEHLMIVDLERNDLGRVCRFGSIGVPSFCRLRSFPSLHHLESEVAGELVPGTGPAKLLRATFPGGSITGAPKIRAMQIIDEIEPVSRGFYTGAIGLLEPDGGLRLNIAIRTATAVAGTLLYQAGGAIVADSDPADEYEETLVKARGFLAALQAEAR